MGTVSQLAERRELSGDRAERIVEAMRASVATRGFSASTFDQVARDAGVSRGLLHYHFGSKERLLVEAVRRECELRHEQIDRAMAGAGSADEVMAALVHAFEEFLGEGPSPAVMMFEMITLAQRNGEIAAQLADQGRRLRTHIAEALREKADAGALELRADADTAASILLALADGITIRLMTEPELDIAPLMAQSIATARTLLG
ncbi:MAG TPA: TetR family transcriptional regulator [Solirubrobacteraceae bacterium]|jgi:AcrR family transcriptional regulator|nr:TetR family transcriptional regulator [Solirubrobacteraceae bacterium]